MATIWVPPLLQVVVDKLATLLIQEIGSIIGIKVELSKLERTFQRAKKLINSVEKSRYLSTEADPSWLRRLKEAVDDADDIVDEIGRDPPSMQDKEEIRIHKNNVSIISSPTIAHRITCIRNKLDEISKDMEDIILLQGESSLLSQQTTPVLNRSNVYGRETELIDLRQVLKTSPDYIVSLLGRLGIGKTVLAKLVFNDDDVKNHFKLRVWVSAAAEEDFNVKGVAKLIIESATGKPCDLINLHPILTKLSEVIDGLDKFLLVLDGVFYEEYNDELDDLLTVLRKGTEGSKILITAQNEILVSKIMGTTYTYRLGVMSDDDCWAVFKGHAFNNRNEDEHPKLVAIGRRFISKWQGMPLVAKTLGKILRLENDENEWQTILSSEILDLRKDKKAILDSLRLTWYYLPHHLRQCIAYCSLFPCEFEKDRIIELWIAEGLIHHSQGKKGMVDIGNDYFNKLLLRSFFEYVDEEDKSICKMPNLIRVLAQYISNGECFRIDDSIDKSSISDIPKSPRHLSLLCANIEFVSNCKFERSRTFLVWCKDGINIKTIPPALFQEMRRLRVLVLSDTSIEDLPNSICNLKYLRYVDLSRTSIKSLPESMSRLDYLHTLKLVGCGRLIKLLKDMKNLINLQHLHLDIGIHLVSMPTGMGNLTKLQSLSVFLVGKELGYQVGELGEMSNLRGSLCIAKLENVTTVEEAKGAMLNKKQHIQKLELHWTYLKDADVTQEVLTGLEPHHNLAELQIRCYGGVMFPSWIGSSLFTNMVHISLEYCLGCYRLPRLGQLPSLKFLCLREFHKLKCVDHMFCGDGKGFPALETLIFDGMSILEAWDGLAEGDFPLLHQLTITSCPKLLSLPILSWMVCLQYLEISSCKELNGFPEAKFPASLQSLTIEDCPILGDRCLMEEGGDRHKIANISRVVIDYEIIFPIQV